MYLLLLIYYQIPHALFLIEKASFCLTHRKTKAIIFGSNVCIDQINSLQYPGINMINNIIIPFVNEVKNLGVMLDSKLL